MVLFLHHSGKKDSWLASLTSHTQDQIEITFHRIVGYIKRGIQKCTAYMKKNTVSRVHIS